MIPPRTVVLEALRPAAPYLRATPLLELESGARLKLELLQPTGSFKVRGFFTAALGLPSEALARGLMTVSAGNAALACAYVARRLGVPCRVVMVDTAPAPKVEGVRRLGAIPVFMPRERLFAWMAARGWESEPERFIHPFADDAVILGHAGIGVEIVQAWPEVRRVVVAVGGGGLVSGVAIGVKSSRPEVEVIGVQSDGYPLWTRALEIGGDPGLTPVTIADGTAAPFHPGMLPRMRSLVDRWVTVPEAELRAAIIGLAHQAKVVAEGAGALAFAALPRLEAEGTVAVVSGGNIAPDLVGELVAADRAGAARVD